MRRKPRAPGEPRSRGPPTPPVVDWLPRRGVAQSGSAPVWGTGGRRFKSGRPDQFSRTSQAEYRQADLLERNDASANRRQWQRVVGPVAEAHAAERDGCPLHLPAETEGWLRDGQRDSAA